MEEKNKKGPMETKRSKKRQQVSQRWTQKTDASDRNSEAERPTLR